MAGPATVGVFRLSPAALAAFPARQLDDCYERLEALLPGQFGREGTVLELDLMNINAVMHPAQMVCNASWIEATNGGFCIYQEGTGPAVGRVIDAVDNFASRFLLNDVCVLERKTLIEGAILRFTGLAMTIKGGETACYRCLFPREPAQGDAPTTAEAGVFGPVPAVIGAVQAAEDRCSSASAARSHRLLQVDLADMTFTEVEVARHPACPVCGERSRSPIGSTDGGLASGKTSAGCGRRPRDAAIAPTSGASGRNSAAPPRAWRACWRRPGLRRVLWRCRFDPRAGGRGARARTGARRGFHGCVRDVPSRRARAGARAGGRLRCPPARRRDARARRRRFAANPRERCASLGALVERGARAEAVSHADGANRDDLATSVGCGRPTSAVPPADRGRPGRTMCAPCRAAGLATADKPQQACLASRLPYGSPITAENLRQVAAAEDVLRELGFDQCRVRHHGDTARIEVEAGAVERAAGAPLRDELVRRLRAVTS
jgi:hypothetical protein